MNHDQYPYDENEEENRQFFNFPGFFGFPGFGGGYQSPPQSGGPFPGQGGGPFPGGQPSGPPTGGSQFQSGPPTSAPPSFTPQQPKVQTFAVDPGGIRGCLFRFTYIWLRRDSFWFYPVHVGRQSVAGYRWDRFRWVYFGVDLKRIQSYQCY